MKSCKIFFHADHVGSLLRPAELHEARARASRGEICKNELRQVEDKCIRESVAFQEGIGLQAVTDGEFRRDWWHIDFLHGFEGIELSNKGNVYGNARFKNLDEKPPTMVLTGKIRRTLPSMLDHFTYLRSVATHIPRFTMPSPAMLHGRADRDSIRRVYPDIEEFWCDLTSAYRAEIRDLYLAGCRYIQIDDTTVAMMSDPKVQDNFRKLGDDPAVNTSVYADALNSAIRDVPTDMTVAMHTCRGNFKSTFLADGSYDFVAESVFSTLNVDTYFLEYDTERAGGFEPLRFMPKGKNVVLGLVSSKFPEVEKKGVLKHRVDDAAKYVPMENLAISPQCGFSSTHHGNIMTESQQGEKLTLCVETAREIWGSV